MDRFPIYLDSNVIIDVSEGRDDELLGLILRSVYFGPYCYPFTAEQVTEVARCERQETNQARLMLLSAISGNNYFEHSVLNLGFRKLHPSTVLETLNEVPAREVWNPALSNGFPSYDQQLAARNAFGLTSNILNNLSPQEALLSISSALANYEYPEGTTPGVPRSLDEMIEAVGKTTSESFSSLWHSLGVDPEAQLRNQKISGLFVLLDALGFWSDSKSIYKKGTRFADSRHAFNASYFTKVVSTDKHFLKKSEAAYVHYSIATAAMETSDFKAHLRQVVA